MDSERLKFRVQETHLRLRTLPLVTYFFTISKQLLLNYFPRTRSLHNWIFRLKELPCSTPSCTFTMNDLKEIYLLPYFNIKF